MDVIIYHNPECGTSRNTLAMIRNAGIEPHVIEYLKTPPTRELLRKLVERMGTSLRSILRVKDTPYGELGLGDPALTDEQLFDAIEKHPILMNRPIVVSPKGVKLPSVRDGPRPLPAQGAFAKEDGEQVTDAAGNRLA
jgi:arsenate reductase